MSLRESSPHQSNNTSANTARQEVSNETLHSLYLPSTTVHCGRNFLATMAYFTWIESQVQLEVTSLYMASLDDQQSRLKFCALQYERVAR